MCQILSQQQQLVLFLASPTPHVPLSKTPNHLPAQPVLAAVGSSKCSAVQIFLEKYLNFIKVAGRFKPVFLATSDGPWNPIEDAN